MNNKTKKSSISCLLIIAMLTMVVFSKSSIIKIYGSTSSTTSSTVSTSSVDVGSVTLDDNDTYTSWDKNEANYITLNGSSITFSGSGAVVEDNIIKISSAGTYVISGTLTDGQIWVEEDNDGVVRLVLNGASISCSDCSPIYVKNAGKTIVSLEAGTENYLSDGSTYVYVDATEEEPDATLFSKDDLTINGTGKLTVDSNFNNAINAKDTLKIVSGTFDVTSVDDAIIGHDNLYIYNGNFNINATGDVLKSSEDSDTTKGNVYIADGEFVIVTSADGIQAENSMLIADGTFNVTTNASGGKGLVATTDITISGGTFTINSTDDALNSNNSITINGGVFTISSGEDGMHSDTVMTINAGTINITKCYEGLESATLTINNGEIHLVASDDGINVADGTDSSPGTVGTCSLVFTGGYTYVNAAGDGLDANGSIKMTGGTVLVNGPTDNGNGALDYDSTFVLSGGTFVCAGSSGMAMAPSTTSTQPSMSLTFTSAQTAGTIVQIVDSSGNNVLSFAPAKSFSNIVISSPSFTTGKTYTIYTGSKITGTVKDGLYTVQSYTAGTTLTSITIQSIISYYGSAGQGGNPGGGPGGGGGFPGMATATPTPTTKVTATPTPTTKVTATPTPTTKVTATPTPTTKVTATPTPTPKATATPTPTPKATATPTPTAAATATPTPTVAPTTSNLDVKFLGTTSSTSNSVVVRYKLTNNGSSAITLSNVKLRYYFTEEGTQSQNYYCDWSTVGSQYVTGTFTAISPALQTANYYLETGFASGAGSLAAGQSIEIQGRFSKADWSSYTLSNDYSYKSAGTSYENWTKVTAYLSNTLIYGVEP